MDTQSIVKRIIDLKKVSVQLKQSTEDPEMSNTSLIQSLLQFGRSISASHNKSEKQNEFASSPSQNYYEPEPNQNQPLPNVLMQILQNSKKQPVHRSEIQSSVSGFDSSGLGKTYNEPLTPIQQINQLRHNNSDIEQEIRILKQKLKKLQEIEKMERQEQWKDGLPYFVLNIPKMRIFYTKLTIVQSDYDKIDYCMYSVSLNLQKITLSQLPQTEISNRPPKSITLMLADLKQVNYHNNKSVKKGPFSFTIQSPKEQEDQMLIVYHFKHKKNAHPKARSRSGKKSAFSRTKLEDKVKQEQEEIVQTLFMKFNSEQELKQWDLGVFINFKIMEDLNKNDFKIESYNSMNSSTIGNQDSAHKKKENDNQKGNNIQFNDLIQKMSKSRRKVSQIKAQESDNQSDKQDDEEKTGRKPPSLQKNYIYSDEIVDSPIIKANNNIKIVDDPETHENKDQSVEQETINKERSNTSHFGGLAPSLSIQEKIKLAEQEKVQTQELRKQKLAEIEENKRKQAERIEQLRKTEYELSVKRARQSLRKGYEVTKYAKSAFSPHDKKIYLSEDGKRICWKDLKNSGQTKSVLISEIISVNQATYGKGMEPHVNLKKFNQNKGRYAVINLNSKDRKSIDLSTRDQRTMESFCKDLQLYRKNLKQRS